MKIKTSREFLDIPAGSIGQVVEEGEGFAEHFNSIYVKFECKKEAVLVGLPNSHFEVLKEEE